MEREHIARVWALARGHKGKTCQMLGISRPTLERKLKKYGLAGGVYSASVERAQRVARRLRTGQVEINGAAFNPLAPFGGYKRSGHGRELGRLGLEEFLTVKAMQL